MRIQSYELYLTINIRSSKFRTYRHRQLNVLSDKRRWRPLDIKPGNTVSDKNAVYHLRSARLLSSRKLRGPAKGEYGCIIELYPVSNKRMWINQNIWNTIIDIDQMSPQDAWLWTRELKWNYTVFCWFMKRSHFLESNPAKSVTKFVLFTYPWAWIYLQDQLNFLSRYV